MEKFFLLIQIGNDKVYVEDVKHWDEWTCLANLAFFTKLSFTMTF